MKNKPIYIYQCIICKKNFRTENTTAKHCGKLMQWIAGIEGKGINVNEKKVKIKVGGYIEMSEENLNILLSHNDPHTGLIYAIPMGYCNASNLDFEPVE